MTRPDKHTVALLGNPNTGKSTLFTALTGTRQKVANFPGVTVEAKLGTLTLDDAEVTVIDLPGTYSLAARSPDERIATEALLGRIPGTPRPDGVLIVLDASSLERNLYLATQVLEFGLPAVVALTMVDVAKDRGITVDAHALSRQLGVPVVPVNAPEKQGLSDLRAELHRALHHPGQALAVPFGDEFDEAVTDLHDVVCDLSVKLGFKPARPEALRLLVDGAGPFYDECEQVGGQAFLDEFNKLRQRASGGRSLSMIEAQGRYGLIGRWVKEARKSEDDGRRTKTDRVDALLTHKVWGTLIFVALMLLVFQSIYSWAGPLMDGIELGIGWLGAQVVNAIPEEMETLRSLLADGVFGGVAGVLVFLPQILILFLFIAILEDLGYMSRAAFLMDRLMAPLGLSGRSFIPLLSAFACAIPGIMGTRVIEDRNTRLTTIFLAPFMSCSARLPVYTLFIAAFVPDDGVGPFNLQGLVLFAMYWVGVLFAIPTALVLKRGILKSKITPFLMELPSYKMPRPGAVARVLLERGGSFIKRAGTIIFAVSIIVWALAYFPRDSQVIEKHDAATQALNERHAAKVAMIAKSGGFTDDDPALVAAIADMEELAAVHEESVATAKDEIDDAIELEAALAERSEAFTAALLELKRRHGGAFEPAQEIHTSRAEHEEAVAGIENAKAGELLAGSFLGRAGHAIEPAVRPLGWDWRIGMAAIASFPAREVIIATLGTIFNLGGEQDEESEGLRGVLRNAKDEHGNPLFTLATALSVMVFFALCAQCAATLAVIRRETNSWKWPAASFVYMTTLAYIGALVTYQVASALGA
ncbi:MAG: ferrous iron transport protein B [Planctomycetes bacterium]|nr:ferrous iron transport protein B [Planctomycetota bacterium]MCW8135525.1 ferrous iron transport protein B [Planctomycetota bacterium]